jgi:hypothetical protein
MQGPPPSEAVLFQRTKPPRRRTEAQIKNTVRSYGGTMQIEPLQKNNPLTGPQNGRSAGRNENQKVSAKATSGPYINLTRHGPGFSGMDTSVVALPAHAASAITHARRADTCVPTHDEFRQRCQGHASIRESDTMSTCLRDRERHHQEYGPGMIAGRWLRSSWPA